jgi:outer membrane protein OmpA-like peptidoglycan-associated protein
MKLIKNLCTAAMMTLAAATANAQDGENYLVYPQIFIGAQGGAQTTLTDYNNWKLATPTASFSIGSFFTPVVGARLHLNGTWNKGGYKDDAEDFKYKYRYLTTDLDMMVNLCTLIGRKNYYPLNVYLIGGIGFNYAWDNSDAFARKDKLFIAYDDHCFSHNARVGLQLDWNVSKHVGINLEVDANNLKDRYNSKMSSKGDWQLTAQLGVAYKFSAKKGTRSKGQEAKSKEQEPAEVWETRQDTIWYDDVVEASRPMETSKTWTVFYESGQSDFEANSQLQAIGAFLREWSDCKVEVKSYADKKTGNPQKNMELSRQRCEKAVKALVDAGVPASSITSNYYGDTIQPFAENDKNRVTIILASGHKDGGEKKMVKKFRTKEVRYRVK